MSSCRRLTLRIVWVTLDIANQKLDYRRVTCIRTIEEKQNEHLQKICLSCECPEDQKSALQSTDAPGDLSTLNSAKIGATSQKVAIADSKTDATIEEYNTSRILEGNYSETRISGVNVQDDVIVVNEDVDACVDSGFSSLGLDSGSEN
ncbi:uncharacterized protein [Ptychodera flava]|uniref:uncharacterized protein n=1 Tax=Ptychodera flava TaxID=63121 RepID=UPI00396A876A